VIVIGVDQSPAGKEALRYGLHEASIRGTRARAVHAWLPTRAVPVTGPGLVAPVDVEAYRQEAEAFLRATVDSIAGEKATLVERALVESPPGEAIIDSSRDAELIVVGRRGLGAVRSFVLGSVSTYVIQHAKCPVTVIPPPHD
jgi:nucleotide-binding universal stress UspA family protein